MSSAQPDTSTTHTLGSHAGKTASTISAIYRQAIVSDFVSESAQEAIARVEYLVLNGHRLGLLVAPAGVGKTHLLKRLAKQLQEHGTTVALLSAAYAYPKQLAVELLRQLGEAVSDVQSPAKLWLQICDLLVENTLDGVRTAILIDDIDLAGKSTKCWIERLASLEKDPPLLLTLVATCREENATRLPTKLLELARLWIELEPWELDEVKQFVGHVVEKNQSQQTFTDDAIMLLYDLTRGVARHVCHLVELALLVATAEQVEQIDDALVEKVYYGLATVHK